MGKTSINITENVITSAISTAAGGEIGMVVNTLRGKAGVVHTVTSIDQYNLMFGESTNTADRYAKYLISRGNIIRLARLALPSGSLFADATFYRGADNTGSAYLTVTAIEKGTSYNGINVKIERVQVASASNPELFSMVIKDTNGKVLESYIRCSIDPDNPYFVGKLNSEVVKFSLTDLAPGDSLFNSDGDPVSENLAGGTGVPAANKTSSGDYHAAVQLFSDLEISITTFLLPDVSYSDAVAIGVENVMIARKNCLFIPDFTGESTPTGLTSSTYTSVVWPSVNMPALGDDIPASIPYADRISDLARRGRSYLAPAGVIDGVLSGVSDVYKRLSSAEVSSCQEQKINPVVVKQGRGVVVWGQYTTSGLDDIQSVAVRLLANYLKRNIYSISMNYMFRPNNSLTWNQWIAEVEPLLLDLLAAGGIREYQIICDDTIMSEADIANGILRAYVSVWTVSAIENIEITFTVDETGVTFE